MELKIRKRGKERAVLWRKGCAVGNVFGVRHMCEKVKRNSSSKQWETEQSSLTPSPPECPQVGSNNWGRNAKTEAGS